MNGHYKPYILKKNYNMFTHYLYSKIIGQKLINIIICIEYSKRTYNINIINNDNEQYKNNIKDVLLT